MMERIPCKKCLLKDVTKDDYFQSIYEYIESIQGEVRTPDQEYKRRLDLCCLCDNLINGMCRLCGCFVEVRAIKKMSHCADTLKKW